MKKQMKKHKKMYNSNCEIKISYFDSYVIETFETHFKLGKSTQ